MSLVFLTRSVLSVLSEWLLFGVFNCALRLTLCTWRDIFSPTLLCAGLLPLVTIVSTSHSSRFNLIFLFHSLMVKSDTVPSLCHMSALDVPSCCDALLFHVKWVCVCACGYHIRACVAWTTSCFAHIPVVITLEGEACMEWTVRYVPWLILTILKFICAITLLVPDFS